MASYLIQQIGYAAPVLLVYLIGAALSVFFLRSHPLPGMLALAATLILILTSIGVIATQAYLVRLRVESGWTITYYSQMTMIVSIIGTVFRTVGAALLVAAVFTGRKNKTNQT